METGVAPAKQIKVVRMQRAAELLGSTFLRIKEVADRVGAGDVSHFVRDFKLTFSVTPSDYRQGLRKTTVSGRL
jgi:AraC-like DNA-binding protein